MAGRGPAPTPGALRSDRHKVTTTDTDDVVPAPPLAGEWSPGVVAWYQTWASSPQGRAFFSTDWQRLQMLAPLVAEYLLEPSVKLATEIRLQESLLGATVTDRLRLNLKPPAKAPAPTASTDPSRRLKVV
jgi:hypothetical protein